ncbi:MAG: ParB/RepB/Spo0J family partition protein [Verrucomicrobiales bacterium]|nr:ParB/RepB/Spo0J family partition protein [Verrucomicrobiales bacterium]
MMERLARQAAGTKGSTLDPIGRDLPRLVTVPLKAIEPDPAQPRKDLGTIQDLALSIRAHGLLQPIIVEAVDADRFRILAGERRFAACRELQLESVPCIVRTTAEHSRLALQLIENLHRKDLHPLEVAQAYQRLMEEFGLTQRELAQEVGKSLSSVNETLRLLNLPPEVQADVRTSEQTSKAVLLEISKAPEPETQREMWQQAREGKLTTRTARKAKRTGNPPKPRPQSMTIELEEATVTVRFKSGEATSERVRVVLATARAQASDLRE